MDAIDNVVHIDRVRCLECGTTYTKPADGGTVSENPGCPRCAYVGWIHAKVPSARAELRRSGEGQQRPAAARSH